MSIAEQEVGAESGGVKKMFQTQRMVLILLVTLSAVGIAVTDAFPKSRYGYWYWLAMGPIFCAINLYTSWARLRDRGHGGMNVLVMLLLHWAAFLVAVYLVFLLLSAQRIDAETAGLVALLALALTAFLAGVHSDWRFCLAGMLLGSIVAGGAFVERFLWMLLVPMAVALILAVLWWPRGKTADVPTQPPPA